MKPNGIQKEFMEVIVSGATKKGKLERKIASLEGVNQHHLKKLAALEQLKINFHKRKRENEQ